MRRLLDIDNPVMRFLTAAFELLALSVLWLFFSLPVFTMGAASAALYSAAYHHVRRGEDYLWNSFLFAFRENFRRSTLAWLAALAVLAVLGADGMLLRLALALGWTVYLSAYGARFNGTVREVLRFSFILFRAHPVKTGCVIALVLAGIGLALTFPAMIIFIPGAVYWGATFPIESVFLQHMRPEDRERMNKEEA